MKRFKQLYPKICAFDNLIIAARKARKGKQFHINVASFEFQLEKNLLQLHEELRAKSYLPGPYRSFMISDPKERMISAAPYRDRVVHHALMNITAPLFERTFIHDTYANREGKGTHLAIERYQYFASRFPYVLKCDIRKFFPSIDHQILKQEIRWKIACPDTLWLCDLIIDNSNPQELHPAYFTGDNLFSPINRRKGLPIGNLTSQWWANVYLNRFDHYIKEHLRIRGYIRYVDDFVVFGHSREKLTCQKQTIIQYLDKLKLYLHPYKTQIYDVHAGIPFLGYSVYPTHRIVLKPSVRRYERYLRKKLRRMKRYELTPEQLELGLNSWLGHIRFCQSQRLENRIFSYIQSQGVLLVKHPNGSWRVLE